MSEMGCVDLAMYVDEDSDVVVEKKQIILKAALNTQEKSSTPASPFINWPRSAHVYQIRREL